MKRLLITIAAIILSIQAFSQTVPNQYNETVTLTDYNGETYNINELLNNWKYVIFDFFYTTCGHCQAEVPDVVNLYNSFGCNSGDVIIIGLECVDHDAAHDIDWYITEFGATYPIAPLANNPIINELANNWEIDGTPTYVLIQPNRSMNEMDRPINTMQLTMLGAHEATCPDQRPVADFEADRTFIPVGESINFTNLSERASVWAWTFSGGTPSTSNEENPGPIVYNTPGDYSVTLTASNQLGDGDTKTRTNYIKVVPLPTEAPTAYFAANQVTVIAGNTINFTDLSQGEPWQWTWSFEGANPSGSTDQNPHNIRYNSVGHYNVTLIVQNPLGSDTLTLENYINVIPSIGDEVPKAKFSCNSRLVQVNTPVRFTDESEGYPMYWEWEFEGGNPATCEYQVVQNGVTYENSGIYDVKLAVSNPNGGNILNKRDYIVVYENYVGSYCDTLCNLIDNETAVKLSAHGLTGYLGGHNSDRITTYADKFEYYTFNEISSIIVPILKLEYTNDNEYITFITWDGNDPVPTTILSEQKVYLRNLSENYYQQINFATPLKVDGPFYLGYRIKYSANTDIVIGMANNRGYGHNNTMYVLKDSTWQSLPDAYDGITSSTGIKVASCLVGIEDETFTENVAIFPNPCNNILNIENAYGFEKNDFIEIFDNLGRLVYSNDRPSGNNIEINVSYLPVGTYITRMFTQGKIAVQKFDKIE